MARVKYITQAGVARLWAAIEQKFIDNNELTAHVQQKINEIPDPDDMTNFDIDAITGYDEIIDVSQSATPMTDIKVALNNNKNVKVVLPNEMVLDNGDRVIVSQGKKLTLTINDVVTNNDAYAFVANGGEIILDGEGSVSGAGRVAQAENGGVITVNGGDYTTTSAGQIMSAIGEGSKIIVNQGNFNSQESGLMAFDGAEVEVNGGTFTTIDNFAIGTNGTPGRGNNIITIKNAKIYSNITSPGYIACGIYAANNDTIIIDEGTEIYVNNGCGICQRGGHLIIKDGVKITTTTDANFIAGGVGDKEKDLGADGIIFDEESAYPGHTGMSLTVEDGVIFNVANGYENIKIYPLNGVTPDVTIE